ncbi:MAG: histone deacetylase [Candidatus Eiseniibacteriota bacterium]|jgi:acetoin utilization deacetylase AcuC-like enzyme
MVIMTTAGNAGAARREMGQAGAVIQAIMDAMETRLALIDHPIFTDHRPPGGDHPERPERLEAVRGWLERSGLGARCEPLEPPPVDDDAVLAVHDADYLESLRRFVADAGTRGGGYLNADTYAVAASLEAARRAAGGLVAAVDRVLAGSLDRALSLGRPPGHHATRSDSMGFCLLNSVAIAAVHARRRGAGKVLVVDWDVHHGNGTQDIFYDDPDVIFFSTHQWPLYPGTGRMSDIGTGDAAGATVNVPLPPGTGDDGYRRVFEQMLVPLAARHRPDLILVSAGFDAHVADPLAAMNVTTAGFGAMAQIVAALADEYAGGRLVASLEGGYHLDALGDSVVETLRVFLGEAPRPAIERGDDAANGSGAGSGAGSSAGTGSGAGAGRGPAADDGAEGNVDRVATIITAAQAIHMLG